jgi:hypothetical protein
LFADRPIRPSGTAHARWDRAAKTALRDLAGSVHAAYAVARCDDCDTRARATADVHGGAVQSWMQTLGQPPSWTADDWLMTRTGSVAELPHANGVAGVVVAANTTSVGAFLGRVAGKARALVGAGAYLHWYERYGIDRTWIDAAVSSVEDMTTEYAALEQEGQYQY